MSWINDDGLYIRFGVEKTVETLGGESTTDGNDRTLTMSFAAEDLGALTVNKIMLEGVTVPDGAVLRSATLNVTEAFVGATGTLDIGLVDSDRTTEFDFDGIDAAIAVTALTEGAVIECDGVLIGTVLDNTLPMYVTMRNNTADFTAGEAQLVVKYYIP